MQSQSSQQQAQETSINNMNELQQIGNTQSFNNVMVENSTIDNKMIKVLPEIQTTYYDQDQGLNYNIFHVNKRRIILTSPETPQIKLFDLREYLTKNNSHYRSMFSDGIRLQNNLMMKVIEPQVQKQSINYINTYSSTYQNQIQIQGDKLGKKEDVRIKSPLLSPELDKSSKSPPEAQNVSLSLQLSKQPQRFCINDLQILSQMSPNSKSSTNYFIDSDNILASNVVSYYDRNRYPVTSANRQSLLSGRVYQQQVTIPYGLAQPRVLGSQFSTSPKKMINRQLMIQSKLSQFMQQSMIYRSEYQISQDNQCKNIKKQHEQYSIPTQKSEQYQQQMQQTNDDRHRNKINSSLVINSDKISNRPQQTYQIIYQQVCKANIKKCNDKNKQMQIGITGYKNQQLFFEVEDQTYKNHYNIDFELPQQDPLQSKYVVKAIKDEIGGFHDHQINKTNTMDLKSNKVMILQASKSAIKNKNNNDDAKVNITGQNQILQSEQNVGNNSINKRIKRNCKQALSKQRLNIIIDGQEQKNKSAIGERKMTSQSQLSSIYAVYQKQLKNSFHLQIPYHQQHQKNETITFNNKKIGQNLKNISYNEQQQKNDHKICIKKSKIKDHCPCENCKEVSLQKSQSNIKNKIEDNNFLQSNGILGLQSQLKYDKMFDKQQLSILYNGRSQSTIPRQQTKNEEKNLIEVVEQNISAQHKKKASYQQTIQCPICYQFQPKCSVTTLECHHTFCNNCLIACATQNINQHKSVACPFQDCRRQINQDAEFIKKLPKNVYRKYRRYLAFLSTLEGNTGSIVCPNEQCDDGVIFIRNLQYQPQLNYNFQQADRDLFMGNKQFNDTNICFNEEDMKQNKILNQFVYDEQKLKNLPKNRIRLKPLVSEKHRQQSQLSRSKGSVDHSHNYNKSQMIHPERSPTSNIINGAQTNKPKQKLQKIPPQVKCNKCSYIFCSRCLKVISHVLGTPNNKRSSNHLFLSRSNKKLKVNNQALFNQHRNCKSWEDQYISILNSHNFRRCDRCQKLVEKFQGCNHITCKCGYQFCYRCTGKWRHYHLCNPFKLKKLATPLGQQPQPSVQFWEYIYYILNFLVRIGWTIMIFLIFIIPTVLGTAIITLFFCIGLFLVGITYGYVLVFDQSVCNHEASACDVAAVVVFPIAMYKGVVAIFNRFGRKIVFIWRKTMLFCDQSLPFGIIPQFWFK